MLMVAVNRLEKGFGWLGTTSKNKRGFYYSGECFRQLSCPKPMTLDTKMMLALLQELLMALRENEADGCKAWLALDIEQLARDVAGEVESEWVVHLLVEEERDRLMAWELGVSIQS